MKRSWVCFGPGDTWLSTWMDNDLGHVFFVTEDETNYYVWNARFNGMEAGCFSKRSNPDFIFELLKGPNFHAFEINYREDFKPPVYLFPIRPSTCVTLVKYYALLKCWSLTPKQLFKKLNKMVSSKQWPRHIESINRVK